MEVEVGGGGGGGVAVEVERTQSLEVDKIAAAPKPRDQCDAGWNSDDKVIPEHMTDEYDIKEEEDESGVEEGEEKVKREGEVSTVGASSGKGEMLMAGQRRRSSPILELVACNLNTEFL